MRCNAAEDASSYFWSDHDIDDNSNSFVISSNYNRYQQTHVRERMNTIVPISIHSDSLHPNSALHSTIFSFDAGLANNSFLSCTDILSP